MKQKPLALNAVILGFALFAMFFGAGNLIFPPAIGVESGTDWFIGYFAYFMADVGFGIAGIVAMLRADGDMNKVTGSAGKIPAILLNIAIILCIGPLLAIPRTAATTFEMGANAFFGDAIDPGVALVIFSIIFFAIVYVIAMNPGKVMARIGEFLTPILLIVLAILIILGIMNPAAQAGAPLVENLIQEGMLNGYQTLDMLAALVFSIIVVETVKGFGYTDKARKGKAVFIAALVSSVTLLLVYGGLAYLGATTGQLWATDFINGDITQAALLTNIAMTILGSTGSAILIIIVFCACLTTAIGLVSSCSEYFHNLSGGKANYKAIGAVICVCSAIICNAGLAQILAISVPILLVVYPVAMFLTFASLFRDPNNHTHQLPCKLGAFMALIIGLATVLCDQFGATGLAFVHMIPLDFLGFNWLIPTLIAAAIGYFIDRAKA